MGAYAGRSHVFVGEVERGKSTAHIGKAFDLLDQLGVHVNVEIPESLAEDVMKLLGPTSPIGRDDT